MTESNLNNFEITIKLTNETFDLNGRNQEEDFILNNAPNGLSVNEINLTNNTELIVVLSFTGEDFNEDINNFSITVLSDQLSGNTSLTTNTLSIKANTSTEINSINSDKNAINIFPNPNDGKFTIETNSLKTQNILIKIININGEIIFEKEYYINKGRDYIKINTNGLKTGIYTIISNSKHINSVKKIIIN